MSFSTSPMLVTLWYVARVCTTRCPATTVPAELSSSLTPPKRFVSSLRSSNSMLAAPSRKCLHHPRAHPTHSMACVVATESSLLRISSSWISSASSNAAALATLPPLLLSSKPSTLPSKDPPLNTPVLDATLRPSPVVLVPVGLKCVSFTFLTASTARVSTPSKRQHSFSTSRMCSSPVSPRRRSTHSARTRAHGMTSPSTSLPTRMPI
mmetsp:Transcript_16786/g.32710  ORF Transcript_16786/g.32710 Transcript_16786/m.32710 type:complete len:209 (-) Transcript_16786:1042-1668(-)